MKPHTHCSAEHLVHCAVEHSHVLLDDRDMVWGKCVEAISSLWEHHRVSLHTLGWLDCHQAIYSMRPLSYIWSTVDWNIVMWHKTTLAPFISFYAGSQWVNGCFYFLKFCFQHCWNAYSIRKMWYLMAFQIYKTLNYRNQNQNCSFRKFIPTG